MRRAFINFLRCSGLFVLFSSARTEAEVLLDKIYPFSLVEFNFSELNTVSFSSVSSERDLRIDLKSCLESVVKKQVNVITSKKEGPVDVNSLIVKIQFFIVLFKIKQDLFIVNTTAIVNGTTFNGTQAAVPIYGNTYVIQTAKNPNIELEQQIKKDLERFFSLYMKTNSENSEKVLFYCEE